MHTRHTAREALDTLDATTHALQAPDRQVPTRLMPDEEFASHYQAFNLSPIAFWETGLRDLLRKRLPSPLVQHVFDNVRWRYLQGAPCGLTDSEITRTLQLLSRGFQQQRFASSRWK